MKLVTVIPNFKISKLKISSLDTFIRMAPMKADKMVLDLNLQIWAGFEELSVIKKLHEDTEVELRIRDRVVEESKSFWTGCRNFLSIINFV